MNVVPESEWLFPRLAGVANATEDLAVVPDNAESVCVTGLTKSLERLPDLKRLRCLQCLDVNEVRLNKILKANDVKALYLENLTVRDISFVNLFPNLRILRLEGGTKVTDLSALSGLRNLLGLSVEHFPRIKRLDWLSPLTRLRALDVSGSMWTSMTVESLAPIGELRELRFLSLTSLKTDDELLRPLAELRRLKLLSIANRYPMEEFARLAAQLPDTRCDWFKPHSRLGQMCDDCGEELLMLTGKGARTTCPRCHAKRLARHIASFHAAAIGHSRRINESL